MANYIRKPELNEIENKANALYVYLKNNPRYCTKEELGLYLGISNERSVREVIATLAEKVSIISTSDKKGYKLSQSGDDLEANDHTWKELDKKMYKLYLRKKPLIKFHNKYYKEPSSTSKCKACGSEILWITTMDKKLMPCNPQKVTIVTEIGEVITGYIPHWSTCPNANNFRKEKKDDNI